MEAGCPGRRAGSFAEIGNRLILYAKNCLGKRAHKPECSFGRYRAAPFTCKGSPEPKCPSYFLNAS